MGIRLKNTTDQFLAAVASYLTAAYLFTVSSLAKPEGQINFRHTGSAGYWYIGTNGLVPTLTVYSKKLAPGEPWNERNMPTGDVSALASSDCVGALEVYTGWHQ